VTGPSDASQDAEARLAEAKAQLAAAEQAYRVVVPCEHSTMTTRDGERFYCFHCGTELPDPRGCQHRRIDNDTRRCTHCGELMVLQHRRIETVRSAPNAAACTNPECSGDIHDPNCGNSAGLYVPDESRERVVPIMAHYTYTCDRCRYDGDMFMSN